jgi:hypothetical protein
VVGVAEGVVVGVELLPVVQPVFLLQYRKPMTSASSKRSLSVGTGNCWGIAPAEETRNV